MTVVVFVISWVGLVVKEVQSYPSPQDAWDVAHDKEPVAWELARSLEEAHEANFAGQKKKASIVRWSGYLLLVQSGITTAAALTFVFT